MTFRSHRHCPGIAALLTHFRNAIWLPDHEKRFDDTDVKQQGDPEEGDKDPQPTLPRISQVEAPTDHMCYTGPHREHREYKMADVPCLVPDVQFHTPQGSHHQRDQ